MSELIPFVAAVTLMVLGCSYLLHTDRWVVVVRRVTAEPEYIFPAAIVMTAAGLTVGYGYDDWNGTWPIFVTLLGWLLALEGALILLFPGAIGRFQSLPDAFLRHYLRFGGLVLALLGFLLWRSRNGG